MTYFAGIDGGQSATVAVIGDESGRVLSRGTAGPADEIGQDASSTRMHDALAGALAHAIANASLPADTRFARIVAGVSGYEGRVYGKPPALPADACELVHDSAIAHAGALAGGPGVVVIAGTGSVGVARNASGGTALAGGWGYLFGDEGSAFWLARAAVSDAMRDHDAGQPNDLAPLALQHFGRSSLREVARAFYAGEITRAAFADFAREVIENAERGGEAAAQYVHDAAASLANLAMRALVRAGLPADAQVAFTGGLTKSSTLRDALSQQVRKLLPSARHVAPAYDGAAGALLLAYRAAGLPGKIVA